MSEIKHTPGPWAIRESATHITVLGANNESLFHDDKRVDCVIADARLIAAAPQLLDLLIKARRYVGLVQCDSVPSDDPIYGVMDDIDAAIAKATGDQS